nr:flagellin [uncultured Anaerovibrio sp.]
MRCEALGLTKSDGTAVSVATREKAVSAITVIDRAISRALKQQTIIGAVESRLEFTAANITTAHENVTASESVIRDADMAKSFTAYTRANVLMQTAQSMLGQANQDSSNVLQLLR